MTNHPPILDHELVVYLHQVARNTRLLPAQYVVVSITGASADDFIYASLN